MGVSYPKFFWIFTFFFIFTRPLRVLPVFSGGQRFNVSTFVCVTTLRPPPTPSRAGAFL